MYVLIFSSASYELFLPTQMKKEAESAKVLKSQQDDNYFNLLTVPPPSSTYFSTPHPSINPRLRRTSFQQRNHYSQLGSHRSSNISYPSRPLQNNNLWILFEERPKNEVIKKILQIYINKNNIKFTDTSISIVPIFIENKFEFI